MLRFCTLLLAGGFLFGGNKTASVTLAWDPPHDKGIVGYRVYYSDITKGKSTRTQSFEAGRTTRTVVPNLVVGHTYSFVVTAINASGKESPPSNMVKYVVPSANRK